jgi:flavin reductase (DIM6/NTAB) family NADH-FMN oxidoreductase RutF
MKRIAIPVDEFAVRVHQLWSERWILLTAGDFSAGAFNTMAVGWGGFGVMWGRPFAHVVVRPGRYTHEFMEKHGTFTLSVFSETHGKAVQLLGTKSGRDGDKISESGLTPVASTKIAAPGFAEADLIVECRKIYRGEIDPAGFLDESIGKNYPLRDYHTVYYGEVLAVEATASSAARDRR